MMDKTMVMVAKRGVRQTKVNSLTQARSHRPKFKATLGVASWANGSLLFVEYLANMSHTKEHLLSPCQVDTPMAQHLK